MATWDVLLIHLLLTAGAAAGATWFAAYLREKGKHYATTEDLEKIVAELRLTTRATEDIKAEISRDLSVKEKRWAVKFDCYSKIAEAFGELESAYAQNDLVASGRALEHLNKAGTVARIVVEGPVRALLSGIADRLNATPTPAGRVAIAHNAWMGTIDVARHDLFKEKREMKDYEIFGPTAQGGG